MGIETGLVASRQSAAGSRQPAVGSRQSGINTKFKDTNGESLAESWGRAL